MKKKLVAMTLVAAMVASLTACGGSTDTGSTAQNGNTEQSGGTGEATSSSDGDVTITIFNSKQLVECIFFHSFHRQGIGVLLPWIIIR